MLAVVAGGAWCSRVFFWGNNLYEEIPGQLYRSARLSTRDLDDLIVGKRLQGVITFTGGSEKHPWYVAQKRSASAPGRTRLDLHAGRSPAFADALSS